MNSVEPKFLPEVYRFLKAKLETDLLQMDVEVSEIATLVQDAAEKAAMAAEIRDSLKDAFSLVSAKIGDKLRKDLGPNGKEKAEARIDSEKILDPDYQKARLEYSEARLDASLWESIVEGMRTKSQHLRTASDQLLSGYITQDFILQKRREQTRKASPPSPRIPLRSSA